MRDLSEMEAMLERAGSMWAGLALSRDPFAWLQNRPLERRDFGWGGAAWTRPILPVRYDIRVEAGSMASPGMGASLDAIVWEWPRDTAALKRARRQARDAASLALAAGYVHA